MTTIGADMKAADLDKTLETIAKQAPALRKAGVISLVVDNVTINLMPPDPPQTTGKDGEAESDRDPLEDPFTYGGPVPQRKKVGDRGMRDDDDAHDDFERG